MAINISDQVFNINEYVYESLTINCNSKDYRIEPIQLLNLYIEKNFDDDYLPIIMMQIIMSDELYYNICMNPTKTTFTFLMKRQISISEKNKSAGSIFLSDKFVPLGVDGSPFNEKKMYDSINESDTAGKNSTMTNFSNSRTFILAKRSDLNATKSITNLVLSNSDMLNAVSVCLTKAGVNKVLMSPMDNYTGYSELILLPQPLVAQLKYLNSFYGFYKEGAQIFFDLDCLYILRNTAKCTAYRQNEIQTVYFCIYDTTSGKTISVGSKSYSDTKTAYIGLSSANMSVDNLSTSSNEFMGSNSTIINNDGNISTATSGNGSSYNVLSNRTHNNYYSNELSLRMKELSCVVRMVVQNIDLTLLTPNKTFRILASDTDVAKKVSGAFRLVSTMTTFNHDGNKINDTTIVTLKRTDAQ